MYKTIFAGTTNFGIPTLEYLKQNTDLIAIITQPDKPFGRNKVLTAPPAKEWALKNNVQILQPNKIIDAASQIAELEPDLMIVAAYGQIIPKSILELPVKGSLNLHGSLLPKYRGASPIQAAIIKDEKETGVTVMHMDELLDHGPIISSIALPIADTDDYLTLHDKLAVAGAKILSETLPNWMNDVIKGQEQDHEKATFTKLITRNDAKIDWTSTARDIVNKIRALGYEPGTWTTLDKKSVKIIKAEEVKSSKIDLPGKIYSEEKYCLVKCGDYSVKLLLVQPEGKKTITGQDFLNGLKNLETKIFV